MCEMSHPDDPPQAERRELPVAGDYLRFGILILHSVNPYGFKNFRRVTENNVDLNRNSDTEISLYANENPGYGDIYGLLNPAGKVNTGSLSNQFFYVKAIANIIRASMATLRQAVLQGQYDYPEGLYYGGNDFEPQIRSLHSILPPIFDPYESIFEIDLHTGYGERRVLHLFPNPVEDQKIKQMTESIFPGQHIDWGDSDDFYTITGDFSYFLRKIKPVALYLNMPFEFGTLNSQKTFGSLKSIQNMILENQGANYGYKRKKDEKKVKEHFLEMYYPSSEAWRSEVMKQARDMLELVIENYLSLGLE